MATNISVAAVSALSVMLGGLIWGWLLMHVLGESGAKILIAIVSVAAVLVELDFDRNAAGSAGLLAGLVFLIAAIFRPTIEAAIHSARMRNR